MGPFLVLCPRHCAMMTAALLKLGCAARRRGRRGFLPLSSAPTAELNNVIHKLSRLGIDVASGAAMERDAALLLLPDPNSGR